MACLVATLDPTPCATILIGATRRKKAIVINKVLFNLEKGLSLMLFTSMILLGTLSLYTSVDCVQ